MGDPEVFWWRMRTLAEREKKKKRKSVPTFLANRSAWEGGGVRKNPRLICRRPAALKKRETLVCRAYGPLLGETSTTFTSAVDRLSRRKKKKKKKGGALFRWSSRPGPKGRQEKKTSGGDRPREKERGSEEEMTRPLTGLGKRKEEKKKRPSSCRHTRSHEKEKKERPEGKEKVWCA